LLIFETLLIEIEGAKILREYGVGETIRGIAPKRGSPERQRKAKGLERDSTGKF
jgi:hypothetical protein